MDCTDKDLSASFTEHTVTLTCRKCSLKAEIPSLVYFKKWGYPRGLERVSTSEWLHEIERRVGRDMMDKIKIEFRDVINNVTLGYSTVPYGAITKLAVGDKLEFKDTGLLFGLCEIQSFAVNQGYPEGHINLIPLKAKAKIKLQQINEKYVDTLLPF